jgi:hypothetical protein
MTFAYAAASGNLEVLEWLKANGFSPTTDWIKQIAVITMVASLILSGLAYLADFSIISSAFLSNYFNTIQTMSVLAFWISTSIATSR